MTPLLIAGATSVANYLASRQQGSAAAGFAGPNQGTASFESVLRGVSPEGAPRPAVSDRTRQLESSPEVKAALQGNLGGGGLAVTEAGDVLVESDSGRRAVSISPEIREIAKQVYHFGRTDFSPSSGGSANSGFVRWRVAQA